MLSPEFRQLNEIVESTRPIILRHFRNSPTIYHKTTPGDYVTRADLEAERAIIEGIEKLFPNSNIIAEEHGEYQRGSSTTFVVDPLDGTNNFVLGIPAFTTSVAMIESGEIIYGVVHEPIEKNTYVAVRGAGAFLNDVACYVNAVSETTSATVSYFCRYDAPKDRIVGFKSSLLRSPVKRHLDLWSPALSFCLLASGRMEAIINDGTELYDHAAGKLIAAEAGARITDFAGNRISDDCADFFVASNGTSLHDYLVRTVTSSRVTQ